MLPVDLPFDHQFGVAVEAEIPYDERGNQDAVRPVSDETHGSEFKFEDARFGDAGIRAFERAHGKRRLRGQHSSDTAA